jgi:ketosteroid isomerase-like protein
MSMSYESMMTFAESWIAAWNRRDVDAMLAHYSDSAQFVSPVASELVGRPILRDKKELELAYGADADLDAGIQT